MAGIGTLTEQTMRRLFKIRDNLEMERNIDPGDRVEKIFKQSDFPPVVNGKIPLDDFHHYIISSNITIDAPFLIPEGGSVEISSNNFVNNDITIDIGTEALFQGADIQNLLLRNLILRDGNPFGAGTATVFDTTSLPTSFNALLNLETVGLVNFKSLGTIEGFFSVSWTNVQPIFYATGLVLKNFTDFFGIAIKWDSQLPFVTTDITLEGTGNSFQMVACEFSTSSNTTAMHLDSASSVIDGRVTDCSFVAASGSQFFDPAGKNQTDVNWAFRDNGEGPASVAIGSMFFTNNAGSTVITTQNVYTEIVGTAVAGVSIERFTFVSGPNRLTYTGIQTVKGTAFISVSGTDGASGSIFDVTLFQDTGSGFIEVPGATMPTEFDSRTKNVAFSTPVACSTGDVFKVMLQNTESIDDITISSFQLNIVKG